MKNNTATGVPGRIAGTAVFAIVEMSVHLRLRKGY
jgi:hypothetical protein